MRFSSNNTYDELRDQFQMQARIRFADALDLANGVKDSPPLPTRPKPTDRTSWHDLIAQAQSPPEDFGGNKADEHPALTAAVFKSALWLSRSTGETKRYAEARIRRKMAQGGVTGSNTPNAVRYLRDFPEDWILQCDQCEHVNEEGWEACSECHHDRDGHLDVAAKKKSEQSKRASQRAAQRKSDRLREAFENDKKPNPYTSDTDPLRGGPPGGYAP